MPPGNLLQDKHNPDWALLQGLEQLQPCNIATYIKINQIQSISSGACTFVQGLCFVESLVDNSDINKSNMYL